MTVRCHPVVLAATTKSFLLDLFAPYTFKCPLCAKNCPRNSDGQEKVLKMLASMTRDVAKLLSRILKEITFPRQIKLSKVKIFLFCLSVLSALLLTIKQNEMKTYWKILQGTSWLASRYKCHFCQWATVCIWANYFISLSFGFLACELGLITQTTPKVMSIK